jgi:hypothetical protein
MKKNLQKIISSLIVLAVSTGAYAVVRVSILETDMKTNDKDHVRIEKKIDRILCKMGETSNCE